MKLSVYALPSTVPAGTSAPAVIIDVLRATSVMVTALAAGASRIVTTAEVDRARALARAGDGRTLLAGERQGLMLPGFDLGNSPLEYTASRVAGRKIVLTTSNGTQAIAALAEAQPLYVGAFLNAQAVAGQLALLDQDAILVCSGTYGRYTLDDIVCAGMIAHRLCHLRPQTQLDDLAYTARFLYDQHQHDLAGLIGHASHFAYLQTIGLQADIDYCLQTDITDIVPVIEDGIVQLAESR